MKSTTILRSLSGALVFLGSLLPASTLLAASFLVNPGVYTGTPSSTFSASNTEGFANLFDGNNSTNWAIDGFAGHNSQGRDEGWISVQLDQTYLVNALRLAPRKPSGNTDGIDAAYVWVSATPFNVDVTSAASTNAFLATPAGAAPNLTTGPFVSTADVIYALSSNLSAKYLLGRFVNTSDHNSNRNLGVRSFEVQSVPEPGSMALCAMGLTCWLAVARRRPSHKSVDRSASATTG